MNIQRLKIIFFGFICFGWYSFSCFHTCILLCISHSDFDVGFTTTYAISVYLHSCYEFESSSWRGVLNTILFDKTVIDTQITG